MATPYSANERIHRKLRKTLKKVLNPNNEGEGDGQRMRAPSTPGRVVPKKTGRNQPNRRVKMKEAVELIIKHAGGNIARAISEASDECRKDLALIARSMVAISLKNWKEDGDYLISSVNESLRLCKDNWRLNEDTTISHKSGKVIDPDWLYNLAMVAEGKNKNYSMCWKCEWVGSTDGLDKTNSGTHKCPKCKADLHESRIAEENDPQSHGKNFSRAGSILNSLDNNTVMNYLEDAVSAEMNPQEASKQRAVWEETGINWRYISTDVSGDDIVIRLQVKYTTDGSQEGVKQKDLAIRVQSTPESSVE